MVASVPEREHACGPGVWLVAHMCMWGDWRAFVITHRLLGWWAGPEQMCGGRPSPCSTRPPRDVVQARFDTLAGVAGKRSC